MLIDCESKEKNHHIFEMENICDAGEGTPA